MTRVLVTGGAGFVGSHVVDAALAEGLDVRVLDRAPSARLDPRAELVEGDVRDAAAVARALRDVDAVSHQAARVGLGVDFADVDGYVADNDVGTATLLRSLHEHAGPRRIVLAGSMVVYGEGRYRCEEHGDVRPGPRGERALAAGRWEPPCPVCGAPLRAESVPEDAPTDPRNVYAATKLHQEHLCQVFGREHDVGVTVLRYHNVYGPRMPADTPYAGVASIFASALRRGDAPRVFEDGGQRRDFVHVRDVARANLLALTRDEPYDGVCNVASGSPRSVLDLARALHAAFPGAPVPVVTGEFRLGDVRHVFASTQRARDDLGFVAEVPFADGVRALAEQDGPSRG